MRTAAAQFILAGMFGLAMTLAVTLNAQNTAKSHTDNQSALQQGAKAAAESGEKPEQSRAFKAGYQDGKIDRDDNLQAHPRDQSWTTETDRLAYDKGYHQGYCAEEAAKTGYYNGDYTSYNGPTPVLRNGYYGYNAPNPECVSQSANKHKHKH